MWIIILIYNLLFEGDPLSFLPGRSEVGSDGLPTDAYFQRRSAIYHKGQVQRRYIPTEEMGAPSCHIEHRLLWSTLSPGNFIAVHIPKLLRRRNPTSFCNIFARTVASREFCHALNLKGSIWTSNGMFGTWMRDQGLISSQFGEVNDIDIFTASARWLCMCMTVYDISTFFPKTWFGLFFHHQWDILCHDRSTSVVRNPQ